MDVHDLAAVFFAEVAGELPPPGDLGVTVDALAAAYLFHRATAARRLLPQALAAQGRAARMGFLAAHPAYEDAGRAVATAVFLRCARVFETVRQPGALGGWKPGPGRSGALGLIERLERAVEF